MYHKFRLIVFQLIAACPCGIKTVDTSNMGPLSLETAFKIFQDLSKFPLVILYVCR